MPVNIADSLVQYDPASTSFLQVVAPIGEKCSRVTATSGREAYTIEAAICADGKAFDPMVVFKGKHTMANWGMDASFKGNFTVSDSGWMNAEIFHNWFEWFSKEVTARPLLLIMDGHSSHLSYNTIKLVSII